MMAKAQQINFESRVRLLTVLHEALPEKETYTNGPQGTQ
jgi:hypothetical protein